LQKYKYNIVIEIDIHTNVLEEYASCDQVFILLGDFNINMKNE